MFLFIHISAFYINTFNIIYMLQKYKFRFCIRKLIKYLLSAGFECW